ncbi:MAG: DUF642 domain-containing protein, partial [Dolichospermum sp.]
MANSALDFPGSHARIRFKIKRLPNQPVGTIIENQVGIFFDHEPEVKTNIIASKVIEPCPASSIISGNVSNNQVLTTGSIPATFTLSSYQGIITGWEVSTDSTFSTATTTKYPVYTSSFNITTPVTQTVYVRATVQTQSCQISPSQFATVTVTQPLTASVSAPVIACNGGHTDAVFTISGGTAPYTTSPSGEDLVAGSYTFTITDANGFTTTTSLIVTENQAITATATSGVIACNGGNTNVTITPTGGTAPYTISPSTSNVVAGTHLFTITDANGCTGTTSITITEPEALIKASKGTDFCVGSSNTLTAIGGNSYLWNTGETTASINVSNAGTYSVTISTTSGCSVVKQITVKTFNCMAGYCPGSNNLLSNGSFESPSISSAWSLLNVPNWTNVADGNRIEVHKTALNIPVPNGNQYIELNGTAFGTIHQDITVLANKTLKLSFKYRGRTTANESIKVTLLDPITNSNIHTFNANATFNVWNEISANYTTSSAQTRVRVRLESLSGQSAGAGNLIDDVVLNYLDCADSSAVIIGNNLVCEGSSTTLSLLNYHNIVGYLWSNGSTNSLINVNQPGVYSVVVTLANGSTITSNNFEVKSFTDIAKVSGS